MTHQWYRNQLRYQISPHITGSGLFFALGYRPNEPNLTKGVALMAIQVNSVRAKDMITIALQAGLVPMLKGSPGTGKSAIVKEIADEYNMQLIDLRLSQCSPEDLLGFPYIDQEAQKSKYVPFDTFPTEGDPLPEGKNGWLLFLDELNSADRDTQKASYKLIYDRMVGQRKLHKNVMMVGAGNLTTDNAIVEEMSTALQSRLIDIEMVSDSKAWLEWATQAGIHHHITSYIRFKPGNLNTFADNKGEECSYACERTWHFADRILQTAEITNPSVQPLLAGTIGEGTTREFIGFTKLYKGLPGMDEIKASPDTAKVPTEPGSQYAISGAIAHHANAINIDALVQYANRLPKEFQVICLRELLHRNRGLVETPTVAAWVAENNQELF